MQLFKVCILIAANTADIEAYNKNVKSTLWVDLQLKITISSFEQA